MKEKQYTIKSLIDVLFGVKLVDNGKDIEHLFYSIFNETDIDDIILLCNTNTHHVYIEWDYIIKPNKLLNLINSIIKYYTDKFNIRMEIFVSEFKNAMKERKEKLRTKIDADHYISDYMKASNIENNPTFEDSKIYSVVSVLENIIDEITPFNQFVHYVDFLIGTTSLNKNERDMIINSRRNYILSIASSQDKMIESILKNEEPNKTNNLTYRDKIRAFRNSINFIKYLNNQSLKNDSLSLSIELIENKFNSSKQQQKEIILAVNQEYFNYTYSDINNKYYYPLVVDIIIGYSNTIKELQDDLMKIKLFSNDYKTFKALLIEEMQLAPKLVNKIDFYQSIKEKDIKKYIRKRYNELLECNLLSSNNLVNQLLYKDSNSYKHNKELEEIPKDITLLQIHTKKLF